MASQDPCAISGPWALASSAAFLIYWRKRLVDEVPHALYQKLFSQGNPEVCLPKIRVFIVEWDYSRDRSTVRNIRKLNTAHPRVLLSSSPTGQGRQDTEHSGLWSQNSTAESLVQPLHFIGESRILKNQRDCILALSPWTTQGLEFTLFTTPEYMKPTFQTSYSVAFLLLNLQPPVQIWSCISVILNKHWSLS